MDFDNVACSICLIIGMSIGLWLGFFLKWQAEKAYLITIDEYKRKNKKLIYFIRYKLKHITYDEYEKEVKDIEI